MNGGMLMADIKWVDNHWYETTKTPIYMYKDREEALSVINQMAKHYRYKFTIVYDDNTPSEFISTLKKLKPKSAQKIMVKLNLNKIKLKQWNNF